MNFVLWFQVIIFFGTLFVYWKHSRMLARHDRLTEGQIDRVQNLLKEAKSTENFAELILTEVRNEQRTGTPEPDETIH